MTQLSVVILAAGKGTRMHSDLPKVLHQIAAKPMVKHVIDTVTKLNPTNIHLIYGHGANLLQQQLADEKVNWILQTELLGTGHAMQQAVPFFQDDENILMLYGDGPLISAETLTQLIQSKPEKGLSLLTAILDNPTGYGRILRQSGEVVGIVEQKDATPTQLTIQEINTGVMVTSGANFKKWLSRLTNNNAQKEYYITDIIAMANKEGAKINAIQTPNFMEVEGVNNRLQLASLERYYQQQQAKNLMLAGVGMADPNRFDLRGSLSHGKDVYIDTNVIIEGSVKLGNRVKIGSGSILKNCEIADDVEIRPYSIIEDSIIGNKSQIGPFARLRPGANLADQTQIGNFVEIKKSTIGKGSKINHLSYIGDSEIGEKCNIGAGVITCNYDGINKFKTTIGNGVFVGSDSQLIAPVVIEDNATIGAGSTINKSVGQNELVITRIPQRHIKDWKKSEKK